MGPVTGAVQAVSKARVDLTDIAALAYEYRGIAELRPVFARARGLVLFSRKDAQQALRGADVVIGDVSTIAGARSVAEQANLLGRFDAVIHNVAVGYREPRRVETSDGLPQVFATNVLAPYILTALMRRPQRLIYLSSGLHRSTTAQLDDVFWRKRRWDGAEAYSETKLYDTMLAFAIARHWPDVFSNALNRAGWLQRWAVRKHRTTSTRLISRKCGSPRATTRG
jgi:NAD(P)-dependent dehydrogenase (short-subunit alcohol dehydrogenase family)